MTIAVEVELNRLDAPSLQAKQKAEALRYSDARQQLNACWIVDCVDLDGVFGSGESRRQAKEAAILASAAVLDEMQRSQADD